MPTRLCGLALIGLCALAVHFLHRLVLTPPAHQGTPIELLLSLVAVLAGASGAMALLVGPPLFRPYDWPPGGGKR